MESLLPEAMQKNTFKGAEQHEGSSKISGPVKQVERNSGDPPGKGGAKTACQIGDGAKQPEAQAESAGEKPVSPIRDVEFFQQPGASGQYRPDIKIRNPPEAKPIQQPFQQTECQQNGDNPLS